MPDRNHGLDLHERRAWAGKADAYARSFAKLCAHPVGELLDPAAVGAGTRLLDVGTGTGTVARLSASYLDDDGIIAVPTEALLAAGIRD